MRWHCTWIVAIILHIRVIIIIMLSYPTNPFLFQWFLKELLAASGRVYHSVPETSPQLPFVLVNSPISSDLTSGSLLVIFACFSEPHSKIWSTPMPVFGPHIFSSQSLQENSFSPMGLLTEAQHISRLLSSILSGTQTAHLYTQGCFFVLILWKISLIWNLIFVSVQFVQTFIKEFQRSLGCPNSLVNHRVSCHCVLSPVLPLHSGTVLKFTFRIRT